MTGLSIIGVGMTPFGRFTEHGLAHLATGAVQDALTCAGVEGADVGAVFVANAVAATVLGQEMVAGQVALRHELVGLPVFNVENACASGQTAFHLACAYVTAGLAEVVLALGVERMTHADRTRPLLALAGAVDVDEIGEAERSRTDRSLFMELYAQKARRSLERGATREDFAQVAVKNQAHGLANPRAQFGRTVTVDDVLRSRTIVDPLTLFMCSPVSDGAACVVVTTADRARRSARSIDVLATAVRSGRAGAAIDTATRRAVLAAYEQAALGPADLGLVELHDAAAPAEIELYEELDLCGAGEGAALLRSGTTRIGGRLPVNVSGGLLAKGHPVGATGVAQLVEAFEQLTGTAGARQVAGARIALTHNAGGWIGDDNAAAAVSILGAAA